MSVISEQALSVLVNDTDADGDTLSIANITQPTNGTTAISGNNVNYTPNSNYYGLDTFTYTIQDTSGGTATGTVTVKVMTPFTWTGATADGKWSTGGNWCGTVTAGACPGGAAPSSTTTTTHIAVFNSTCTYCNAGIDVNASAYKIELNSSYAGTLTQNSTRTISIGTGGYSQAAGTFTGGDANITFAGAAPFTLSGGTYSATSATTNFSNNTTVTYSTGTFNHNNGTWRFDTVQVGFNSSRTYTFSLTPASMTFYNLTTGGNSNYEWSNYSLSVPSGKSLIVENNFTIARTGGYGNACLIGGTTIDLRGNLLSPSGTCHNGNSSPNNGKILFSGIANQTYQYNAVSCSSVSASGSSTCTLPTFEINKPSGTVSAAGGTTQLAVQNFILTSGTFTAPTGTMRTRTHFTHTGGTFDANSGTFAYDPIQVELRDAAGKFLARGFGNPSSLIAFRSLTRDPGFVDPLSEEAIVQVLLQAQELRDTAGMSRFSHRLCFGEADSLPGLVIDRYRVSGGQIFSVQAHTAGMSKVIPKIEGILRSFMESSRKGEESWESTGIILRNDIGIRKLEGPA